MVTVEELIIKATPEGIKDVKSQLQGMSDSAEETTDSMNEQARSLNEMSNKFAGAMGAITAGFAIVSGGLLTRVPVLGSAMSGLGAILDALGLKIDQTLRPALTPLTDLFFKIADAINSTDGPLGKFVGIIATVVAIGTALGAALLGVVTTFLALGGSMSTVIAVGSTVIGVIGSIAGAIISLPALLVGAVAAIAAFALAYITNWRGTRDKTDAIIGEIVEFVTTGFQTMVTKAKNLLTKFVEKAKEKFTTVKQNTVTTFNELIESATQFGKDLVSNFADGVRDKISDAVNAAKSLAASVRSYMPSSPADEGPLSDLDKTGPGLVDTFASGINANIGSARSASQNLASASDPAKNLIAGESKRTVISIDGREVERTTKSYRDNGTDLRGRYG